jgi:Glycosyl hydrolase family 79 C-terminal beta domain
LTELNSVTCGGKKGVSDTFATALWAPDALFELLRAGVDGVNVHVRARAINAAFSLDQHGMTAHPLFYGMMLFNRTLGPGARLAAVHVAVRPAVQRATHLKVWAVRINGGGLHVLILDKGNRAATVALRVPATGTATVERLLAPSITSRTGVTLAGQRIGPDARWHGARVSETVLPGSRGYMVRVPRMSAALVALRLSQATAGRPARALAGGSTRRVSG